MADLKSKYHIAINSIGYMLRGTPQSPSYTRSVVPSQVNRLAISDLNYSDFSGEGIFYLAQTDWAGGTKSEQVWRDDAKYYYSTNLDTYSNQGEIKVEKELLTDEVFDTDVKCGASVTVGGVNNSYIGANKSSNIKIWKNTSGVWSDISASEFGSNQNTPAYIYGHKGIMWVGTIGVGSTSVLESWDGSSWTDHSSAINTAIGWGSVLSSRSACEVGGTLYAAIEDYVNDESALVYTVDSGANWVLLKDFGFESNIISMSEFNGKLYYLQFARPKTFLRVYDPLESLDSLVWEFNTGEGYLPNYGVSDKLLRVFSGKLIISISDKIYEYNGKDVNEIFAVDSKKVSIGYEAAPSVYHGAIQKGNRLYWGNLVYDGENFFNHKKPLGDADNRYAYPLFVDSSDRIYYMAIIGGDEAIYLDDSIYKATTSKNFIVFNEMSPVVSIDKLLHSVTVLFDKMVSGDEIKIEYSINNRSTWVTAGTLTYTSEGGTNTKREIIIPNSILFNKIWWKVSMANTGGASSPVLLDLIMAYKPMPNYKNRWQMRFNFSNGVKLLTNTSDNRQGSDMNSQLWNEKLTKKQVKFQDIDYLECRLLTAMSKTQTSASISSVYKIPPQGRIRAVSGSVAEEMYYTSAKTNAILGITRGARGTTARAYLSGQVLDNGYDVYVDDITTSLNFTDETKTESIAQVLLIES